MTLCVPSVTVHQVLCPDGRSACPDGATCCQLSPTQYGCCPLQNVSAGTAVGTPGQALWDGQLCQTSCAQHPMSDTQILAILHQAHQTKHPLPGTPSLGTPHQAPHTPSTHHSPVPVHAGTPFWTPQFQAPHSDATHPGLGTLSQSSHTRHTLLGILWWILGPGPSVPHPVPCLPGALHGTPGTLCQAPLAVLVPRVPVTPYLSPQAMSCSDGQHCCPQGTSVPCPLCCAPPCPHPQGSLSSHVSHQAVCCSDGQHCCPQGTTCDLVHSTCTSLGGSAPLAPLPRGKTPAGSNHPPLLPRGGNTSPDYPLSPAHDVKCDEVTSCPDGNTCCRLSSGAWGCCPLEQVRGSPVPPRTNRCFLSSWVG